MVFAPIEEGRVAAMKTVAVVGGSLAGLRAAEALRRRGFEGRIVFVGAEPYLPYDRPPLSKEVLKGEREPEQIALAKPEKFEALGLDLRLGRRAETLDPQSKHLWLDGDERIEFDGLVIATGAAPRTLPDTPRLAGIHVLRGLDDCLALRADLESGPRVAVVGAGFIGAEVAASCRARGLEVTLIEALPTPLGNALPRPIGEVCAAVHEDNGVALHCGAGVQALEGRERVERVRLSNGLEVAADVVVVGIGVTPNTDWLGDSGLEIGNGVVCDASLATKAEGIVAAGDVARWPNPLFGETMRIEHWTNAVEQAEAAVQRLLDGPDAAAPFASVPFVWSDQYDRKFQIAGRIAPDDQMRVCHGSLEERRFVALFGRGERLVGALGMNRARQLMGYRRMIEDRIPFAEALAQASDD